MAECIEVNEEPYCLLAECGYGGIGELLKDICKKDVLPEHNTVIEDVTGFPWSFETKYYTCTVRLCQADKPTLGNQEFANKLEGLILAFDADKIESWTKVNAWLSYLEHLDPPVRLLVCNSCSEQSSIPKLKVQEWCLDNEFELIELDPMDVIDDEDEYDVNGVRRILQVLYAHTWPNLLMKDKPDTMSPYMRQLMDESKEEQKQSNMANGDKLEIHKELGMDADELSNAINNDGEDGVESFEKLFSKLQLMKEKADGLSADERRAYAEKVAMSFWSAMGGSDDELDGVDDSD